MTQIPVTENGSKINERIRLVRETLDISLKKFASDAGLGIGIIQNINYNRTEPNPIYISMLCKAYNINPSWVETGEGEMFNDMTREIKIAQFVGEAMKEESTFKHQLIALLSELDEDGWKKLDEAAHALLDAQEQIRKSRDP